MLNLLNAYRANPVLKNARAIRDYGRKHPFSVCMFGPADTDLFNDACHHANKGTERDMRGYVS